MFTRSTLLIGRISKKLLCSLKII